MGLIQLSFPLTSEPALGTYRVVVKKSSGSNVEHTFEVDEYGKEKNRCFFFVTLSVISYLCGLLCISLPDIYSAPCKLEAGICFFSCAPSEGICHGDTLVTQLRTQRIRSLLHLKQFTSKSGTVCVMLAREGR